MATGAGRGYTSGVATPRSPILWFAVGFVAVIFLAFATESRAAEYTADCPPADDSCAALAERLEAVVSTLEGQGEPPTGPSEISGTVALSETDRQYLGDIRRGAGWTIGLILAGFAGALIGRGVGSA